MATVEDVRGIRDTFGRPNFGVVDIVYGCPWNRIESAMERLGFEWKFVAIKINKFFCQMSSGFLKEKRAVSILK